jgi:hypothetical protein
MVIVIYTLLLLGCSAVLSAVSFLAGRCGRRLPIDGLLPRVVHSARFDPPDDCPDTGAASARPKWPHGG